MPRANSLKIKTCTSQSTSSILEKVETSISRTAEPLPPVGKVIAFWRRNGLKKSSAVNYECWVRRFLSDCARRGISPTTHLTEVAVREFATRYARRRQIKSNGARKAALRSLRAWSAALAAIGVQVPPWFEAKGASRHFPPVLTDYIAFRKAHSNAGDSTIDTEVGEIAAWLRFLHSRKRRWQAASLADVDAYLIELRRRYAVGTVGRIMTGLRMFFRFLHSTGRLKHDLSRSIQCPWRRPVHLPRALPWRDVQRVLRAVDRSTRNGLRDYAMLLMMSLYGVGAGEIVALTLDDIHWRANTITIRRPKTGVEIKLPLLPPVARALAGYLRSGRPPDAPSRSLFIRHQIPHVALTSSSVAYAIRKYASRAGVRAEKLGGHAIRHSYASRQVEQQAPPRVLSSILGHLDPESTSVYTRVAVERLRGIALPVPR